MPNKVGIFDSGMGGLTVLKALMEKMPYEEYLYYADTARMPYGNKSPESIIRYCLENALFLLEKEITHLVIACHTACSYALQKLQKYLQIPVIGIIEPCVSQALQHTKNHRIGLIATKGTIASGVYEQSIRRLRPEALFFQRSCPLFVSLVEEGLYTHPITRQIAQEYLAPLKNASIDTLILGCTHFPFLQPVIAECLPGVMLVDASKACALQTHALMLGNHPLKTQGHIPVRYYTSDANAAFSRLAENWMGRPCQVIGCP